MLGSGDGRSRSGAGAGAAILLVRFRLAILESHLGIPGWEGVAETISDIRRTAKTFEDLVLSYLRPRGSVLIESNPDGFVFSRGESSPLSRLSFGEDALSFRVISTMQLAQVGLCIGILKEEEAEEKQWRLRLMNGF